MAAFDVEASTQSGFVYCLLSKSKARCDQREAVQLGCPDQDGSTNGCLWAGT